MKIKIKHKGTVVKIDDGYNSDEYMTIFRTDDIANRLTTTIDDILKSIEQ